MTTEGSAFHKIYSKFAMHDIKIYYNIMCGDVVSI